MKPLSVARYLLLFFICIAIAGTAFAQVNGDVRSRANGEWDDYNTWEIYDGGAWRNANHNRDVPGNDNDVQIVAGMRVTVNNNNMNCLNLLVDAGSVLIVDDPNGNLNIYGNLTIDGIVTSGSKKPFDFLGDGSTTITLDGTGFIDNVAFTVHNNITIASTADLTFINDITILDGATVTNNGTISCDNLYGGNATGTVWVNATNSYLSVGNDLFPGNPPSATDAPGLLDADATGNTVRYFDGLAYVKVPDGGSYYNLVVEGDKKTLSGNITILNDLTISGQFDVDATNNYAITLAGNWTNNSIFVPQTGTVTLNGTGDQTISSSSGETYNNLTINKASGSVILDKNVTITGTLNMTSGSINAGDNRVIVGTDASNPGTLSHTSGTVIGEYQKWLPQSGVAVNDVIFPVGTSSNYRSIEVDFATIATEGSIVAEFVEADPGTLPAGSPPLNDAGTGLYNTFKEGYWSVSTADLVPGNYDISLTGNGFTSFTIGTPNETRIVYRSSSANPWALSGSHGTDVDPVVTRTGLTSLGEFCFADNTNCSAPTTNGFSGDLTVCTEEELSYSVNDQGNTYYWSVVGGSVISGSTTSNVTIAWDATGQNGSVSVYEKNSCTQSYPLTYNVAIHPIPPSLITGKDYVAKGATGIEYSVLNPDNYTLSWTVVGDVSTSEVDNTITVDWQNTVGSGSVSVEVTDNTVCSSPTTADPVTLDVTIYDIITSVQDGVWDATTTWDCGCIPTTGENVRVAHDVTADDDEAGDPISIVNLIITSDGTLTYAPATAETFTVTGDLTVNGLFDATATNGTLEISTTGKEIDGVGTIDIHSTLVVKQNTGILSTTDLTIDGNLDLQTPEGFNILNYGIVDVTGDLTIATNSGWDNKENAYLKVGGTISTTGNLKADEANNTVEYYGTAAQDIKTAESYYQNVILSGTSTKTPSANLDINGDLTITETAQLDISTYLINLGGDWINTSTHATDPFLESTGTVTFDGSTLQDISATGTETFYNFVINNSAGVTLSTPVDISNNLTLTSGNIVSTSTNILRMTSTAGTANGANTSFVDGPMTKNIAASGSFDFPVGDDGRFGEIGVGSATAGYWTTEYFNDNPDAGTYDPTSLNSSSLAVVSKNEYWEATGPSVGAAAQITLRWDDGSGIPVDATDIVRVAYWNATAWDAIVTDNVDAPSSNITSQSHVIDNTATAFTLAASEMRTINWNGSTDTDWANTSNWDGGVIPSSFIDAAIITSAASNQPVITSEAYTGELNIGTDASVTVNGTWSLTVNGDFTNNGTLNLVSPGNDNPTGSFLPVGDILGSGTVNAELFAAANSWYYVCSPITTALPSSVLDDAPKYFYHYTYDETYDCSVTVPDADPANWVVDTYGFGAAWVYPTTVPVETGFITSDNVDRTITFSGAIKTDDYVTAVTLTSNDDNDDFYDGWNLIGNPYTCAIDWDKVTKTGIDNAAYYYDNTTENYKYYIDASTYVNGATRYIPAMQGFIVKANVGGSTDLTIPRTARVHASQTFYKSGSTTGSVDFLKFKVTAGDYSDETIIRYQNNATDKFDGAYDAFKRYTLVDLIPQISSKSIDDKLLAINSLMKRNENRSIPLSLKASSGQGLLFNVVDVNFPGFHTYLEDKTTLETILLENSTEYAFDFDGGIDDDRFLIHLIKNRKPIVANTIPNQEVAENEEYTYTLPTNIFEDADLGDELTITVSESDGTSLPEWLQYSPEGTFSGLAQSPGDIIIDVKATDKMGESATEQFVLTVKGVTVTSEFSTDINLSIYPNPTTDKFYVEMSNITSNTTIEISDFNGEKLDEQVAVGEKTEVDLSRYAKGVYFVKIRNTQQEQVFKVVLK